MGDHPLGRGTLRLVDGAHPAGADVAVGLDVLARGEPHDAPGGAGRGADHQLLAALGAGDGGEYNQGKTVTFLTPSGFQSFKTSDPGAHHYDTQVVDKAGSALPAAAIRLEERRPTLPLLGAIQLRGWKGLRRREERATTRTPCRGFLEPVVQ